MELIENGGGGLSPKKKANKFCISFAPRPKGEPLFRFFFPLIQGPKGRGAKILKSNKNRIWKKKLFLKPGKKNFLGACLFSFCPNLIKKNFFFFPIFFFPRGHFFPQFKFWDLGQNVFSRQKKRGPPQIFLSIGGAPTEFSLSLHTLPPKTKKGKMVGKRRIGVWI